MLVLKLISISMDYQDGMTGKKSKHAVSELPSILEYCGYLGGMNGIMVGPHFYYDDYTRYASGTGEYANLGTQKFPRRALPALKALGTGILCAGLFAFATKTVPRSAIIFSKEDMSFFKRFTLSFLANMGYRSRFYFAWHLSESAYILSGFGFDGYEEDGKTATWTKAINAPIADIELNPSAASVVTRWNCHTGQWLRTYVYERVGGRGFWPVLVTQIISGVWHGMTTGYVLFFFNSAILIHCSRVIYRIQKEYLPKKYLAVSNEVHRVHTLFNLNYVAGSYAAGNVYKCLGWFASLYYLGHIEMLTIILVGTIFFPRKHPKRKAAAPASQDEKKKA
ncbi:lysophospholipid acyltransferase [Chloropicon roscoffensis]|uniref:Lysophospholipid acyltransferase n=1 Tax=Chloropicon roscoffensis TaxID=1461544 RepID=A0AAX4PKW5_9CHLO